MLAQQLDRIQTLQTWGKSVAQTIHNAVLNGGQGLRQVADVLHGTWLGHPLHPMLTDIVVGSWTLGALLDFVGASRKDRRMEPAADLLTTVGAVAAVPTAVSGLADFSAVSKSVAGTGLTHAVLNVVALIFYLFSIRARRKGKRNQGLFFSALGLGMSGAGAYLGGHLVFNKKVGVDHSQKPAAVPDWQPVLNESELPQRTPKRVEVEATAVLLYRDDGQVYAVNAVCPHAGGPLDEGSFEGQTVQCPWHDSVFNLKDGSIVHGPTAYPVACYRARLHEGQVEICLPVEEQAV